MWRLGLDGGEAVGVIYARRQYLGEETTMLFMLLMCYDPTQPAEAERRNRQPEHAKLESELRAEGSYVSGAALWPAAASKNVRRVRDELIVGDRPFGATNEAIGGYYIVHCATEDEAVAIAGRIPCDQRAWVRVQAIALFHPDAAAIAELDSYVDPRVQALMQKP